MEHIWSWFCTLNRRRGGGFGPAPLSYQEVDAWARRLRIDPTPWEIDMIMAIDDVWLTIRAEKAEAERLANKTGV